MYGIRKKYIYLKLLGDLWYMTHLFSFYKNYQKCQKVNHVPKLLKFDKKCRKASKRRDFIILVLLSARVGVSRMRDFFHIASTSPPLLVFLDIFKKLFLYLILYKMEFLKKFGYGNPPPLSMENGQAKAHKNPLNFLDFVFRKCPNWSI